MVIICKFLPHKDKALKKQKTVDIFTSRHQPAEVNTTKKKQELHLQTAHCEGK